MEAKKIKYMLPPGKIQGGDFVRTLHVARVPEGTPFEAVLEPGYWSMANTLRAGDKIEVYEDSGKWYAELTVRRTGINTAHVKKLVFVELDGDDEEPESAFTVKWAGPSARFRVVRLSDGLVVSEGHQTKEAAYAEIVNQEKALRR